MDVLSILLALLRLGMFTLALGLTLISFQAYRSKRTPRLEHAFIGFAFIGIGTGVMALGAQFPAVPVWMQIAETIPFLIGFSMLYSSLYR